MRYAPRVNIVKLFWHKFTHTFCKLGHFINASNACCIAMKRSSFVRIVSSFTPKKFYVIGFGAVFTTPHFLCNLRMGQIS